MNTPSFSSTLQSYQNPEGEQVSEFTFSKLRSSGGSSGYPEPFDITIKGAVVTVKNLIHQVGLKLFPTGGTLPFTVTATGYLWAKIDASTFGVTDVVMSVTEDYYSTDEMTDDGRYYFKALYLLEKTGTKVSVTLDLRKSQLPLWA